MKLTSKKVKEYVENRSGEELRHCPDCVAAACNDVAIEFNHDKAYQLVRALREDQLKNPNMEDLKEYFLCDTLLRKQGLLYFCRLIEEIEYEEL